MMQLYKIVNLVNKKVYIGIVYQDGKDWRQRTEEELSLKKCPNKHLRAAIIKYGRENFEAFLLGNYDDLFDLRWAETVQIFIDHSWESARGYNKALHDQHRAPEPVCRATVEEQLSAAWVDFRNGSVETFQPFDTPENVALITDLAKKEPCSIATAFIVAQERGLLLPV
jgi:hypothetical protein